MYHQHLKSLALSLLFGIAWTTSAYCTPGERFHIKEDNTNIHESPTATAPVVGRLNEGDRVIEFGRQDLWVKVSQLGAVGIDGWVKKSDLMPEPQATQQSTQDARQAAQVAVPIEALPNARPDRFRPDEAITPDKIRPGEAITPDTIRPGNCPAFDAATIDKCFTGYVPGIEYPECVDVPRKPSTFLTLTAKEFVVNSFSSVPNPSISFGYVPYTSFNASVHKGRATLTGVGPRECRISKRITRSQAHICRREILLSGAWNNLCYSMFEQE
jgi:uncharacterized protein YgiM (DUF1202 family)